MVNDDARKRLKALLQFSDLGIHKELQARLVDLEISVPTEVQKKVIPFLLEKKKDLVALGYSTPVVVKIHPGSDFKTINK